MSEDRLNEISFVMSMIQKLCEETEIRLIAKELNGTLGVAIQDAKDNKEYVITKVK